MSLYDERLKRCEWFMQERFGMFIHWGLYAIPSRGEWVKSTERITDEEYDKYFDEFNPVDYEPKKWAKIAKAAGMRYAILTAKHHDGFCLFDSAYTDYKATNTKAKRDLVKEFVEAFRAEGIKVGLYYSLLDWHHPDYPHYQDSIHPMRENENFKDYKFNFDNYITYFHNQVRELLTNYGKIDIMWFDFSYDELVGEKWKASELIKMIRELQPQLVIDNRLCRNMDEGFDSPFGGDYFSPEQIIPVGGIKDHQGRIVPWESCLTLNDHWGYVSTDHNYKTAKNVVRMLVECTSKGGNLLINVGPDSKGNIPDESVKILEEVGEWLKRNEDSIYGATMAEFDKPDWGRFTQKGNKLYAHVLEEQTSVYKFDNLRYKVSKARLLSDGSELMYSDAGTNKYGFEHQVPDAIFVEMGSCRLPDQIDTVIEFELK